MTEKLPTGKLGTEKLKSGSLSEYSKELEGAKPTKLKSPAKELTDEIKALRKNNKEFAATGHTNTYCIVVFSTNDDKVEFLKSVGESPEASLTILDGYELCKTIGKGPQAPKFKLHPPITVKKTHR